MKILGIDTIFYSTAAAVVEDGRKVLSNVVIKNKSISSDALFDLPAFHRKKIGPVISSALKKSGISINEISLVAVSNVCSFFSTVAIGVTVANTLSQVHNIPIIGVDHIEAHLFSNWLERDLKKFKFPILAFSSSGASSNMALIKNLVNFKNIFQVEIGKKNRDNSPIYFGLGSVYSNLAYQLGLTEDALAGSLISKFAKGGDKDYFKFKVPENRKIGDLNFFWLRKEIKRLVQKEKSKKKLSKKYIFDFCASFEKCVSQILANDIFILAKKYKAGEIHLAGGISANINLRKSIESAVKKVGLKVRYPVKDEYSTDNAAMIASRGYYKYKQNVKKYSKQRGISVVSDLKLEKIAVKQFIKNTNII